MSQTKVKSGLLNFPDQTDFVKLPSGTTAQRPSSPEKGYSRYNTTDNKLEFWDGTIWQQLPGVVAPIITSISYPGDDLAADPAGGQTITINGTDFKAGATVTVGGTTPSVITFVSATEITFTAPAKAAGDYDIVVTNTDGGNATAVDGMTYNGLPSWTTPAGNLGTFAAGSTIPTITLVATEPDSGVVSYSVTTGALPTGLTLTGADIDGTVPTPAGQTTYNFSVTASDDENQESTERAFNIVVYLQVTNTVDEVDPFGNSSGVALYKLDGDATDVSGNYDGTATNVTYGAGQFSQAASFNPSNSVLTAPRAFSTNSPYSVSGWAKIANGSTTQSVNLAWQITGTSQSQVTVSYDGVSTYKLTVNHKHETNSTVSYNFAANDGQWHHYAVTFNGSSANLYIDGVNVASGALDPKGDVSSTNYIGGANFYNGTTYYNGLDGIDQVRYFNAALTPLEVESLYKERIVLCGGQADTLDILGDNSCIATYQLNGNANDLSGNYSGTYNGSFIVGEFDLGLDCGTAAPYGLVTTLVSNSNIISHSFWVNFKDLAPGAAAYFSLATNSANSGGSVIQNSKYHITWDSSNNYFIVSVGNGSGWSDTNLTPNPSNAVSQYHGVNAWQHMAIALDNGNIKIYLNTNLIVNASFPIGNQTTSNYVGYGTYGPSARIETFDQVRIFNKALNSTEVTTLYNETACDALACSGTTNTLDILSDGSCIAAYPLDGSPADLSGNYNGVQTDVTYPVGKYDLAGSFNGTSSYVDTNYSLPASSNSSFSFWFTVDTTSTKFLAGQTGDSSNYFHIASVSSANKIEIQIGSVNYVQLTVPNMADGNWHHLVISRSAGSGYTAYLDNSNVGTFSNTVALSSSNFFFGARDASHTSSLRHLGKIDQVRIFNKALSAGEVTTLYNETACN